ncbi:hypothetical protein DP68_02155 [Clostridium sp. HMP27]|nr:hypothetical protein DP68_02155 [Clostridium sp. HMP27]
MKIALHNPKRVNPRKPFYKRAKTLDISIESFNGEDEARPLRSTAPLYMKNVPAFAGTNKIKI